VIALAIAALLAVNVCFAAINPCTSAEGAVYERYASHTITGMWQSPFDPRLGLVYGVLARIATRIGGVSELTIRVPTLLGGLMFWNALSYFLRKWLRGWFSVLAFVVIAANPWTFRAFSSASGAPLAIGLLATAASVATKDLTSASFLIGLAIGSDAVLSFPALVFSILAALLLKTGFWKSIDELLLPGLIAGLFLLLLPHQERPPMPSSNDTGTRELFRTLLRQPRAHEPVIVGVSPSIEPGAFFYRRRYHLDWIHLTGMAQRNDFNIFVPSEQAVITKWRFHVIQQTPAAALAVAPLQH
jgi:hypothetical protein